MESILFHGSNKIISNPTKAGGKVHNDFGQGFYCTPDIELAREWACSKEASAFVNHYSFEPSYTLKVCNLSGPDYHALNWIAVLMANRVFDTPYGVTHEIKEYILSEFLPDLSGVDIIRGYRADDSYFSIAKSFLQGSLTVKWLDRALRLGNLGEQVFLKSQRAFDALVFISSEPVDKSIYYPKRIKRDNDARRAFAQIEGAGMGVDGLFATDILRNKIKNDDIRLR